ncbi:MAG: imidazoleglycerol-phosphate dehydratase HisB [Ardenticatenales bacterium]|nr:imidazoleglycerol-phosphate dehydratase HisB [Ardenticatenales bacterium]
MPESSSSAPTRRAVINRSTNETRIQLSLFLDGSGGGTRQTGVPFLDHMLDHVARHGLLDLEIKAAGDYEIDDHHTVEDVGIVLGKALSEALGNKAGIRRYGDATVPMDEALVLCAVDFSGRGLLAFQGTIPTPKVGTFDTELVAEFLRALASNGGMTLHIQVLAGQNSHHIIEGIFKALGRALREAVEIDERRGGAVPSTKGMLE